MRASALASATFADDRGRGLISARRSNIGDLAHYSEKDYGEPQYADGFMRLDDSWLPLVPSAGVLWRY
jgi:hypothetical protein